MDDRRGAFEWGLASVLVGGVMFIAGMAAACHEPPYISVDVIWADMPSVDLTVLILPTVLHLVSLAGAVGGLRSIMIARRCRCPIALGASGVALGALSMFIWVVVSVCWYIYITTYASAPYSGF